MTMPSERRSTALKHIRERGLCGIADLAGLLDVSRVTVHRILDELEEQGLVRKERGGVRVVEQTRPEGRFEQRVAANLDLRREIARKAVKFLEEGDAIFIDASTTAYCFVEAIIQTMPNARLTIATNSPRVLSLVSDHPDYHVTCTGGELDHRLNGLVGPIALDAFSKLQFSKAFISPNSLSLQGIMTPHFTNFEIFTRVLERATEVTMLAESPKFRRLSPLTIAPLSRLKRIITDSKLPKDVRREFAETGVEVV